MKRQRRVQLFLLLVLMTTCSVFSLTAQMQPGLDGYIVDMPARTLPNGAVQPAHRFTMTRPEASTIQAGVIYVLTKKTFGIVKPGERTLANSAVNIDLQGLKVSDISLAMVPKDASDARSPAAVASGLDRLYVIRYEEPLNPFDLCKRLMSNPDVEYAAPARIHQLSFTPNDPRFAQQSFLSKIRVPQAWDITKGSPDVLIAIIDTGVDWMHEDLAANIWMNPGEIAGNNIDDDNNGYIDDVRGWDFVGNVSYAEARDGVFRPDNNPRQPGPSFTDSQVHGTVVAGNAAAVSNNGIGVAGVASNCKILAIKVGSDNPGASGIYQGYPAIRYAADLGADVINCSWGAYGADPAAQTFIDYAISKGSVVVAAAGNNSINMNNNPHSPASLDGVLSVGSVNGNDQPSWFSNFGYANVTYAPGESPLSTYPGNQYRGYPGTSFSSPVAAGVVALVRSLHPDWTPQQVLMQIRMTNDPVAGIAPSNKSLYFGRINAERALTMNATWTSGQRVPGIGLSSFTVDGGNKITSFNETTIRLNLANVLADAQDVIVNVQFSDPNVELLSSSEIIIGDLARNATADGVIRIKLKSTYPWFKGTVNIGLNIGSGSTSNFAFVDVPVELPTANVYNGSGPIEGIVFTQATLSADGNIWGTGPYPGGGGFLIRGKDQASASFSILNITPTAIDAIDGAVGAIGGGQSAATVVMSSVSGGASWTTAPVSSFASSVNAIKLYDASNGLLIGNGTGTKFGIGKTTNGGASWSAVAAAPIFLAGEQVSPRSAYFLNDNVWFGTTSGRVVRSTTRGVSWSVVNVGLSGGVVESIAFRDSIHGVLLYRTGPEANAPKRIASTTNGGGSWSKNVFDPATLGITAAYVASPSGSHHVLVGSNGEVFGTDNEGVEWQPILSQPAGNIVTGKGLKIQGKNTLLLAGSQVGALTYHYSGPNASRIITFDNTTTDYGIIDAGKTRQKFIKVVNSGDGDVVIDSVRIVTAPGTPANAFAVSVALSPIILTQDDDQFGVRCTATDTGTYGATVYVYSNGTPGTIATQLVARVQTPVSVDDTEYNGVTVAAWPNPAHDMLNVSVNEMIHSVAIVDALGNTVSISTVDHAATQPIRINIAHLSAGAYRVLITLAKGIQSVPIVVAR